MRKWCMSVWGSLHPTPNTVSKRTLICFVFQLRDFRREGAACDSHNGCVALRGRSRHKHTCTQTYSPSLSVGLSYSSVQDAESADRVDVCHLCVSRTSGVRCHLCVSQTSGVRCHLCVCWTSGVWTYAWWVKVEAAVHRWINHYICHWCLTVNGTVNMRYKSPSRKTRLRIRNGLVSLKVAWSCS